MMMDSLAIYIGSIQHIDQRWPLVDQYTHQHEYTLTNAVN